MREPDRTYRGAESHNHDKQIINMSRVFENREVNLCEDTCQVIAVIYSRPVHLQRPAGLFLYIATKRSLENSLCICLYPER